MTKVLPTLKHQRAQKEIGRRGSLKGADVANAASASAVGSSSRPASAGGSSPASPKSLRRQSFSSCPPDVSHVDVIRSGSPAPSSSSKSPSPSRRQSLSKTIEI